MKHQEQARNPSRSLRPRHLAILLAIGVAGFGVGSGLVIRNVGNPIGSVAAAAPSTDHNRGPHGNPVTDEHVIARGQENGRSWTFVAFIGEDQAGRKAVCLRLELEEASTACSFDLARGLGGEAIVANALGSITYGEVARQVHAVEIRTESGAVSEATIYQPPEELGLPFNFFVGAGSGLHSEDLEFIAEASDGSVIEREVHPGLPLLEVDQDGAGSGSVIGYSTEEATCIGCDEPTRWIDCGTVCSVALDGAQATLEAHPNDGSIFVEWRGACTGPGPCIVMVDRDTAVEAVFESAP